MSLDDEQKTEKVFDVIIVGAGFAGMSAALHLSDCNINNICILEGNNRIGGRVYNEKVILEVMDKLNMDPKEKTLSVMQKFLNEAQEILYQIPNLNLEKLREASFAQFFTKNV